MMGSITDKTVVFDCPECNRRMMGSTIVNRVRMEWTNVGNNIILKPIYICSDCLEKAADVKNEAKKIKKLYGGK